MTVPRLDPRTVDFVMSVPCGVDVDGDVLVVGDGEQDHHVARDGEVLVVRRVVRGAPRDAVVLTSDGHVLDAFVVVTLANAWRDGHGLALLDLWAGTVNAAAGDLALVERPDGWALVDASGAGRLVASGMRRHHAARLARALTLPLDTLVDAVQDPEGGGFYALAPPRGGPA
ncbi:hypothetical protein [Cellulomonas sp. SLBN-39]|uniref:hypothetical protein n=1 Tax=Cellulomonas sp. SLBN-39 TaxID=2768446 RepID=UPI00114E94C6|nr:hypothetical protein [Cellulomonas sp. SLBN-39]TQL02657.1 hypothetical protein FBY24_1737 [Cellulomonas sp. SLBN-39]